MQGFNEDKILEAFSVHVPVNFAGFWLHSQQAARASFCPSMYSKLHLGEPEAPQDQLECIISPGSPGLPHSETCPEYLNGEASGRHPNQMPPPPQQAPFNIK